MFKPWCTANSERNVKIRHICVILAFLFSMWKYVDILNISSRLEKNWIEIESLLKHWMNHEHMQLRLFNSFICWAPSSDGSMESGVSVICSHFDQGVYHRYKNSIKMSSQCCWNNILLILYRFMQRRFYLQQKIPRLNWKVCGCVLGTT